MTATPSTCITISCDVCGENLQDDLVLHFDDIPDARTAAGHYGWFVAKDGRALCSASVGEHAKAGLAMLSTLDDEDRLDLISVHPCLGEDYYADEDERAESLGLIPDAEVAA